MPPHAPYAPPEFGAGSIHEVSEKIGSLTAHIENLQYEVRKGEEGRRVIFRKIEENNGLTEKVQGTVDQMRKELNGLTPIVGDYQRNKNRALGMLAALAAIGGAIGWLLAEGRSWITAFLFHAPH